MNQSVTEKEMSIWASHMLKWHLDGSMASGKRLRSIEIQPVGERFYELADGTKHKYQFGLAEIRFMNEVTAGRVIFGPDDIESILG